MAKARPATPAAVPAGSAGLAEKPDGVLLRYNEERREWDRITSETPLKTSDRLLCLEPFRAWIDLGKSRIGLVRETQVRILSQPSDPVPSIELLQGRLLVRQPGSNTLKVVFAKQPVTVEMSPDSVLGFEQVEPDPGGPADQATPVARNPLPAGRGHAHGGREAAAVEVVGHGPG